MNDTIRAFIAIELPDHINSAIRNVQKNLKSRKLDIRWVSPGNIHLTLKFLGNIHNEDVQDISSAISAAVKGINPFAVSIKGLGAFPSLSRPRVVWVGVGDQTESLARLYDNIEDQLEAFGIAREERRFTAHLTIGRIKGKINVVKLIDAIREEKDFAEESFSIRDVTLFKSDLKPEGAFYTSLYKASIL
jgi:2'-5' RNA ligase